MKIFAIVGARPNFIKMTALADEIHLRKNIEFTLVHTGQHYDANMSDVFFKDFSLPLPDYNLDISGGSHTYQTANIMLAIEPLMQKISPDVVVVVGDVNSTLAASLVAAKCGFPIAHVEAGLRSKDRTMPEELNRLLVDQLSDFLFVSEQSGLDHLKEEGIPEEKVFFVGNIMIDTLMKYTVKAKNSPILPRLGLSQQEYGLVTLHRPANADHPEALRDILQAFIEISRDLKVLFPIHPRTKKQMEDFGFYSMLKNEPGIIFTEPVGYIDFLSLMMNAYLVMTDSGGIQEETTILGVPCLTIRENTERPITLECGTNRLVGTQGKNIVQAFRELKKQPHPKYGVPPLWDGHTAKRIVDILEERVIVRA